MNYTKGRDRDWFGRVGLRAVGDVGVLGRGLSERAVRWVCSERKSARALTGRSECSAAARCRYLRPLRSPLAARPARSRPPRAFSAQRNNKHFFIPPVTVVDYLISNIFLP